MNKASREILDFNSRHDTIEDLQKMVNYYKSLAPKCCDTEKPKEMIRYYESKINEKLNIWAG